MPLFDHITLIVDEVFEDSYGNVVVFDCHKERSPIKKRLMYYRNKYMATHSQSMSPYVFFSPELCGLMALRIKERNDVAGFEIVCTYAGGMILKVTSIKKDGSKVITYIDDNYSKDMDK